MVLQVNGKDFNLAKIELGRMGALHPANRLAAYLTGRTASTQQRKAFLLRCRRPQDSVRSASSLLVAAAAAVAPPPSTSQPPAPADPPTSKYCLSSWLNLPFDLDFYRLFSDPQLKKDVKVTPTSPKAPQVLLLQVPGPRKAVALSVKAPQAPGSSPNQQRMILQPVPSLPGIKYFRKPDGKLVQLVPVCHLKAISPKPPAQGGGCPDGEGGFSLCVMKPC